VIRLLPFHWTCEASVKLLPLTVKVNATPPAFAVSGEIPVIDGTPLT
jgi:hypothetical protein